MGQLATANLKFNLTNREVRRDLRRLLSKKPGVLGLQEVSKKDARALKRFLAQQGYGIAIVNDVPIAFDRSKFKLKASNGENLASGDLRNVKASWVALEHRKSGEVNVFTNTHLIRQSKDRRLHRKQVRQLARLQRELKQRFGNDAQYFLTGDLNTSSRESLQPLIEAGLNLFRAPEGTGPQGFFPDWIGSSLSSSGGSSTMNLLSDHDAYFAQFNFKGVDGEGGGGGGTGGGGGGTNPPAIDDDEDGDGMNQAQESAFDILSDMLEQYGLGSLKDDLKNLILDGISDPTMLQLELQNTNEWKTRFAGNEILRQNGLPVLSVAEYLSVERSYAQIMKNYGLPQGFWDEPSDFAKLIGASVSPNELNQRVEIHADFVRRSEDPAVLNQLQSMGLTFGHVLANSIDADRAFPLIQREYQTAILGAAARRAGTTADNEYLGHLTDIGVTEQAAAQGYGIIAENLGALQRIGSLEGEEFTQRDFEGEVFEQSGASAQKRKKLASRERARFQGSAGTGQGSLGRSSAGSY